LLEKSRYKAQNEDIINISIKQVYKSNDVVQKEISGYVIIEKILDVFTRSSIRKIEGTENNYDKLILSLLPQKFKNNSNSKYEALLKISCYVASLTDGRVVDLFNKINGVNFNN